MRFDSVWLTLFSKILFLLMPISALAELPLPIPIDDPTPGATQFFLEPSLLVEVAAEHYINVDEPDVLSLETLELGGHVDLTKRVYSDVLFAYDEESESIEFDTLVINFQHEVESQWMLAMGRGYLPFGAFLTHQVNDTLSLEFAETRQLFSAISYQQYGFVNELYVYQDEQDKTKNLGGSIVYQDHSFHIGIDYIESLYDDPAVSFHGHIDLHAVVLIAEHIVVEHNNQDAELDKSLIDQIELAYQFENMVISAAYQVAELAEDCEVAAEKTSLSLSGQINQYAQLGVELARADGDESMKVQLSVLL